jgi:hypothetical protein
VRIEWRSSTLSRASVVRRSLGATWQFRSEVEADGLGRLAFDDRAVVAGGEYDYALQEPGQSTVLGLVHVVVPRWHGLSLAGARPNPSENGSLDVAFTLDRQASGELELLDVTGRLVKRVALGDYLAGNHVARLGDGRLLAPGIYTIWLKHGGRALSRRAVVTR